MRYKVPKNILIIIQNRWTYDDHFIIKQLPEEFEGQFKWLGENTEKYITFSVPIKKEVDNDDDDDGSQKKKTITHRLNFIYGYRFMSSKLSDLVDNLSGIYNKECK